MKLPAKPTAAALACALEIINGEPFHKRDADRMLAWALTIDRHMRVMPHHGDKPPLSDSEREAFIRVRDQR